MTNAEKLRGVVALATISFVSSSCSMPKRLPALDVTGCGPIKWGMTLEQAKMVLGSNARIEKDPKSGRRLESVTITIRRTQFSGFPSPQPQPHPTTPLHLSFLHGHPT